MDVSAIAGMVDYNEGGIDRQVRRTGYDRRELCGCYRRLRQHHGAVVYDNADFTTWGLYMY